MMQQLPVPISGIEWRPLVTSDAAQLAALIARIEARDNPPYRTSFDEILEMLEPATNWAGVVAVATVGLERGRLIAFSHMEYRQASRSELLCQGGVDPHFRRLGIGRAIVDWQTAHGRDVFVEAGVSTASVVMRVDPRHEELEEHLKNSGYRWSRSLSEMRVDLRTLPKLPTIEPYVHIVAWTVQADEDALHAINQAALRNNTEPLTMEEWQKGRSAFAPQWSCIAYDTRGDRPRVAGFVLASRYEQDWAALGWREGYIDQLTVFEQWRHLGLAEALIVHSMSAQKADGMERTGTGVSSDHHTDAHSIYDFLGFREVGQIRLYTLSF